MRLDRLLFRLLHHRAGELPLLDPVLLGCARYGSYGEVLLMVAVGTLGGRRGRTARARCLVAVTVIYLLAEVLGRLTGRPRPFAAGAAERALIPHAPGRSFPSRHVASAVAMAVISRPAEPVTAQAMGALAAGMALGRIRAGLHYPSDVAAGAALGYLVGALLRSG